MYKSNNISILITNTTVTLGNACRLEMVDFLSRNFNTTIVTNRKDFIEERYSHCKVIGYKSKKKKSLPIIFDIMEWKRIAKLINSLKSDLCFMLIDNSPVAIWLKMPIFQYVHQYGDRSNKKVNFIKKIYRAVSKLINDALVISGLKKSKAVFVVSEPIINILKKKGVNKLIHTPHGINIEKFTNPIISDFHSSLKEMKEAGYFIVTYTGWVTENRGFQLMMDTIKEAAKADKKVALVIAGADADFSGRIKDFAEENQLQDNIVNFGVIDVSLIPGILHYSDVCLSFLDDVPAYRISPPQKVIEYFAAGKPVICNKIQTHELLVDHGKTGFILEPDPNLISKILKQLKDNKELYRTIRENVLKEAQKYDIELIYGNMVKKMKEII